MRAHWHHLANTIELVLPSAHPSPQSKRQVDWFSHFCTPHAKCRRACRGMPFPLNCSFPCRTCTPSNTWFLGSTRLSIPNGISLGSAVFAQLTAESPYTMQWATLSPKLPLPTGRSGPHLDSYLIHGSLGPPESIMQTASRSVQPFCRAHDRDKSTERQTTLYSI